MERADLEQVGAIGLMKAVDRYRSPRGAPFEAFASLLVRGELMHYVRDVNRARASTCSLDLTTGSECRSQPDDIDDLLDRLTVEAMLMRLPELERCIVIGIHLESRTLVDVAAQLGYSRRHVTRLHRSALQRLRAECEVATRGGAEARTGVSLSHGG